MKFAEFLGNDRIVAYFQKAIATNHLGHAYLFAGPAGVGKSLLARLICKRLLCITPVDNEPCGVCRSCHKFETENHPDFHTYAPDGLYFKIDLVREIIHQTSMKPVEASWKTFLLEGVDYMRDEAANAFLKVLEEPPGQTIFFLISEAPDALLSTIRSRCQLFAFQPIPIPQVKSWLVQHGDVDEKQAEAMAPYSHGSLARALTLNAEQYREMREKILATIEAAVLAKTCATLFDAIKGITVDRTDMVERLLIFEEIARDLLLLKASPDALLIHQDLAARLRGLAEKWEQVSLQRFYEDLLETREAITKINANIGLQLQALFLPLKVGV